MKKIIYTLMAVALTAVSCSRSEFSPVPEEVKDGKVTFIMKATLPEPIIATKGNTMADDPNIDDIHVAVFGGEGYLNDYTLAIPVDENNNILTTGYAGLKNGKTFYFRVTLNATTSKCSVHIIANGPEQLDFQTKVADIMLNLTTSGTKGGYWDFFDLPNGNAEFNSAGVYVANSDATNKFNTVTLIRNFARFNVVEELENFELQGFNVYRTPSAGFYSIWNGVDYAKDKDGNITDVPQFTSDYHTYVLYADSSVEGYDANKDIMKKYPTPYINNNVTISDETPDAADDNINTATKYIYERSAGSPEDKSQPYLIIKGIYKERDGVDEQGNPKWKTYPSTFYRIDLTNDDAVYFPIYRNFDYTIKLTSVSKLGVNDPSKAIASNGNVSATIGASMTDVSNGASRLLVLYTEKTFVKKSDPQGPGEEFSFAFIPDVINDPDTYGKTVTLSNPAGDAIVSTGANWTAERSTSDWSSAYFYLGDPDETGNLKTSTFQVTGIGVNGKKLYRKITINLLPQQKFKSYNFNPNGQSAGDEVCMNLKLPDKLPESMFPIRLIFEDRARLLSPKFQDMPVETDVESIIPGNTGSNYYHFVKEISYAEYVTSSKKDDDTKLIFPCRFKRIAAGPTTLYIADKDDYFEPVNKSTNTN